MVKPFGTAILCLLALAMVASGDTSPLEGAVAGQWTLCSTRSDAGTSYSYQFVEKVSAPERKVRLGTQSVDATGTRGLERAVFTVVFLDRDPPSAGDGIPTEEEITIKGRKLRCTKTTKLSGDDARGGMTTTITWTSGELPMFGIARRVRLDENGRELSRMDLIEWGDEGGSEKPLAAGAD
jgi:hypothetical protein